jgi:hypothetical protein
MKALLAVGLALAVMADPCLAFVFTVCYEDVIVSTGGYGSPLTTARVCTGPWQDPEGMGGTCAGYQGVIFDFEYDAKQWMKGNCNY